MRVTISDIAKATGYSKTTVSFAFNNPRRISKEARKKVLDAARDLGYIPDPVARSLASGRHGTIGLLLPQPIPIAFQNPYMVHLVRGLGTICNGEGLSLTMLPPKRGNLLNSVKGAAVDGLVTIGLRPEEEIVTVIRHRHIPFVSIDGPADVGVPCVRINDREAARLAMAHLLDHGHCRIAVVVMDDTTEADHEEYLAMTEWTSQDAFVAWTKSDAFKQAHSGPQLDIFVAPGEPAGYNIAVQRMPDSPISSPQ